MYLFRILGTWGGGTTYQPKGRILTYSQVSLYIAKKTMWVNFGICKLLHVPYPQLGGAISAVNQEEI